MAENIWRFEFIDNTTQQSELESGVSNVLGSGESEKPKSKGKTNKTFAGEFTKKVQDDTIKDVIISPLNTMTGGLARPIYRTARSIAQGGSVAGVLGGLGATLGIMAVQKGIEHLQNRLKEVEEQVRSLNDTDNALIRAGSVSKATYYSRSFLGIKKTTNRS